MEHLIGRVGLFKGFKSALKLNQKTGFDCPGCAWPDPDDHRATTEFCENGIKAIAEEAMSKYINEDFFKKHSVEELAKKTDYWLSDQGRLTQPMYYKKGESHYKPISWNEALQLTAEKIKQRTKPDDAYFYTSGRTSNEAAFLYQLLVRKVGTNNLPDCSNMCHESSGVALSESIGIGKGTVTLEDFNKAELVVVMGQNPGTNHPRMLASLQQAKRKGCKIITINPLNEAGSQSFSHPQEVGGMLGLSTKLTDIYLPVKINGDMALLKGIQKFMLEAEEQNPGTVLNHEFIKNKSIGFNELKQNLSETSWSEIEKISGIKKEDIKKAADIFIQSKATIICWAMGLTQHKNAVATIQDAVNVLLLKGHIGIPGAGVCPVRGHSNVQGDRTMGIIEVPKEDFLLALEKEFQFKAPRGHGAHVVQAIEDMHSESGKVFFAMGGNFLSATPDTEYTAQALKNCSLTVHVSTKLHRGHLITGDEALILPCLGRTEKDLQASGEQFVTVENSMGIVHKSKGNLEPASKDLKSEVAIVCDLAEKLFDESWQKYKEDYAKIRDSISRVIPGFEDFNKKVENPSGFYLPNPPKDVQEFKTESGKAHFSAHALTSLDLKDGEFMMMTMRTHDQFNTTVYGLNDRYRGIYHGRRVLLMNPQDMKDKNLQFSQMVNLNSEFNGKRRSVKNFRVIPYDIPKQCVATYFPEANPLVPIDSFAEQKPYAHIEISSHYY